MNFLKNLSHVIEVNDWSQDQQRQEKNRALTKTLSRIEKKLESEPQRRCIENRVTMRQSSKQEFEKIDVLQTICMKVKADNQKTEKDIVEIPNRIVT